MLAGLLVVGCGGPRDPAGFAWTGSYETIDGTAVIQNEGPMVAAGDLGLRLLWRTPPRPVDLNDTTWESPSEIRATATGIYVLDPPAGRVTALNWTGAVERRIGRRGAGPGEILRPAGLLLADGAVGVIDRGAVWWFDDTGAGMGSGRLPFAMALQGWWFGGETTVINSPGGWHLGVPGGAFRLLYPPFPPSKHAPDANPPACLRIAVAAPVFLRTACAVLAVQVLDTAGTLLREITVRDAPQLATDDEIARAESTMVASRLRAGVPANFATASGAFEASRMREKPRYRTARADLDWLVVWEQPPSAFGDGDAVLHLFTRAGVYLGPAAVAEGWIDFDLVDGRIVALGREPETGLAYATAYAIVVPGAALAAAAAAVPAP
jgi:hypothetical protein